MLAARETRDAAKEAKVLRQMFRVHLDRGDLQACIGGDLGVVGVLVTGGAPGRGNKDVHPTKWAHTSCKVL